MSNGEDIRTVRCFLAIEPSVVQSSLEGETRRSEEENILQKDSLKALSSNMLCYELARRASSAITHIWF